LLGFFSADGLGGTATALFSAHFSASSSTTSEGECGPGRGLGAPDGGIAGAQL